MTEINFTEIRAKLLLKGYTIKKWCAENEIDIDRYRNIQQGKVIPNERELELFRKITEG